MKKILILFSLLLVFTFKNVQANTPNYIPTNLEELYKENTSSLMPSTGNVKGLVVPIIFSEKSAKEKTDLINNLNYFYNGITYANNPYERLPSSLTLSLKDYYFQSSYGKLNLEFDVVNPYLAEKNASHYEKIALGKGPAHLINEYLSSQEIDLSKYDSDTDGFVDSLYIVYDFPFNSSSKMWWAYQTSYLLNQTVRETKIDAFVFLSYQFFEKYYASVAIHETGHLLGLDDYYDYDESKGALGGLRGEDMMDGNYGDHNPISKILLGWIEPKVCYKSCDTSLKNFQEKEVILVTDNPDFDLKKDLFSEYILIDYFEISTLLNQYFRNITEIDIFNKAVEVNKGFQKSGIRIHKVDARISENGKNGTYYSLYAVDNSDDDHKFVHLVSRDLNANQASNTTNDDLFITGDSIKPETYKELLSYSRLDLGFDINIKNFSNNTYQVGVNFVNDNEKSPVISGIANLEIKRNEKVNLKKGITAVDYKGNPIQDIQITGSYYSNISGTYKLGYIAYDEEGNKAVGYFYLTINGGADLNNVFTTLIVCLIIVASVSIVAVLYHNNKKKCNPIR